MAFGALGAVSRRKRK
nr:hypothetical protein [Scytonema sp. UIC 10036]